MIILNIKYGLINYIFNDIFLEQALFSMNMLFSSLPFLNFVNASAAKLLTCLTVSMGCAYYFKNVSLAQCEEESRSNFLTNINSQGSVRYLLSQLRDKETKTAAFRFYSDRIMRLLVEQALSQEPIKWKLEHFDNFRYLFIPMKVTKRKAPTQDEFDHYELAHKPEEYCAVTIIRAGDSMVQEVMDLLPGITVGKVLIQRDESTADKRPIMFYTKLPDDIASKERVFVLDPMLATGGSVGMCIDKLKEHGVAEERITFINLISCDFGLEVLHGKYPKLKIITAAIDPVLNDHRYICPGLGDFGDRYFGSRLP